MWDNLRDFIEAYKKSGLHFPNVIQSLVKDYNIERDIYSVGTVLIKSHGNDRYYLPIIERAVISDPTLTSQIIAITKDRHRELVKNVFHFAVYNEDTWIKIEKDETY